MRKRARIALVLGLGQALGRGALAIYTIVAVRYLGQDDYGDVAYALAISSIAASLADLGFSRLIVRDVARTADQSRLIRELLAVRILGVASVTALVALPYALGTSSFGTALWLAAVVYLGAEALAFGYESAAVAVEQPWRFAGVQFVATAALVGAMAVIALADRPTAGLVMWGLALASVLKVLAHAAVWRRLTAPVSRRRLRTLPIGRWLRSALPYLMLAVLATVYYRLGIVALYLERGPEDTAVFAAALRVMDAVALIGYVGFSALSPAMSRVHHESPERLWALWKRMISLAAIFAIPVAASVGAFAEPIAGTLFGDRYAGPAGNVLLLLAPGMALMLMQSVNAAVLLMSDDNAAVVKLTAVNVLINLGLVAALAGPAGSEGVAVATSAAELCTFLTFSLMIRRRYARGSPRAADASVGSATPTPARPVEP